MEISQEMLLGSSYLRVSVVFPKAKPSLLLSLSQRLNLTAHTHSCVTFQIKSNQKKLFKFEMQGFFI